MRTCKRRIKSTALFQKQREMSLRTLPGPAPALGVAGSPAAEELCRGGAAGAGPVSAGGIAGSALISSNGFKIASAQPRAEIDPR